MFQRSILIVMALILSSALSAKDVAATLLKASGPGAIFQPDGGRIQFKAGAMILPGSRIVTREGGTAVLMMDDGSRVSVGPNTDLTLAESSVEGEARSTVFQMVRGLFRATVQKLTVGSNFIVKTGDAVAAVKGTEFEVEADENGTEARVSEGKVWLENAKGERGELRERMAQRVRRGGGLEGLRTLSEDESGRLRQWFRESHSPHSGAYLPADRARLEAWADLAPGERQKLLRDLAKSLGGAWDDIISLSREERQERWRDRLRANDERRLAAEGARVDFALGKTALDRQGRRVRFDEFIIRPAANQMQFLNYTRRGERTDVISSINTYNRDLPRNLAEAPGMNQRLWLQSLANPPRFWVTDSSLVAGNSSGDSFAATNSYYDPYFRGLYWELPIESSEIRLNIPDLLAPTVGGEQVEYWTRQTNVTTPAGGLTAIPGVSSSIQPLKAVPGTTNNLNDISGTNLTWSLAGALPTTTLLSLEGLEAKPGDLAFGFKRTYNNGRTLEFRNYVIDENGDIVNLAGIDPDKLMQEFVNRRLIMSLKQIELRSNAFKEADGINVVSKLLFLHDISKTRDEL